jgi:ubiquinone/menaquinone biosynthesis C-methylase UbiE
MAILKMMEAYCIICHNTHSEEICTKDGFHIVRCQNCSLVYANPLPTEEDLANFYRGDSYTPRSLWGNLRKYLKFKLRMMLVQSLATIQGRFLDVGCAEGDYGRAVRGNKKWEYLGIDLNRGLLSYAKSRGLNVSHGTLSQHNFPGNEFALVTMSHVLEHLLRPRAVLEEVYRILKPSGLVVIDVPDSSHLKAKLKIRQDRWYGPPGHLWFFSKTTLYRLLKVVGFSPILSKRSIVKPYIMVIAQKEENLEAEAGYYKNLKG